MGSALSGSKIADHSTWLDEGWAGILVTMRLANPDPSIATHEFGVYSSPEPADYSNTAEYFRGTACCVIEAKSAADLDTQLERVRVRAGCERLRFDEILRGRVAVPYLTSHHRHKNYDRAMWISAQCVKK